jgi:hypothetical protein
MTQYLQWLIAAAPRHPVTARALHNIAAYDEHVHGASGRPVTLAETLNWTGPGAWSDAVRSFVVRLTPRRPLTPSGCSHDLPYRRHRRGSRRPPTRAAPRMACCCSPTPRSTSIRCHAAPAAQPRAVQCTASVNSPLHTSAGILGDALFHGQLEAGGGPGLVQDRRRAVCGRPHGRWLSVCVRVEISRRRAKPR